MWALLTINTIALSSILFILSAGFSLIFGLMRIINLTHGSFYLLGGYVGISAYLFSGSFAVAVVAGAVAIGLLGLATQAGFLRRFQGKSLVEVLFTLGLSFVLADAALLLWGGDPQLVPTPALLRGSIRYGGIVFPKYRLFVIVFALVIGFILWYVIERTRIGAVVRAGVDDHEMVAALGIDIHRVFRWMFALGSALAGLAGVIGGPMIGMYPGLDSETLLLVLSVVIVGGLGSLSGAALGALFIGFVDNFGRALMPELSYFTIFVPMVLVLAFKPNGLLGKRGLER